MHELRGKSWEDLHVLWWKCVKERNRIHTEINELHRLKAQKGLYTLHISEKSVSLRECRRPYSELTMLALGTQNAAEH